MTRQDELNEAWCKYRGKCSTEIMQALAFALRWCDEHPNWEAIVKRLQEEITNDLRKDRWISVEDELPKIGKDVLIWASGRNEAMIGYYKNWNWQRKTNVFHSYVDNDSWFNVTHWMPLPPAPKKGGEQ